MVGEAEQEDQSHGGRQHESDHQAGEDLHVHLRDLEGKVVGVGLPDMTQ